MLQRCEHSVSGVSRTPASRGAIHHHPDLRLNGAPGDRFKLYQEHIVNLPLSVSGPVHRVRTLWFGVSNAESTIFTTTRTYSHQVQVILELPSNVVCQRAAFYRVTILVTMLGGDLPSQSVGDNAIGTIDPTWGELLRGQPGNC